MCALSGKVAIQALAEELTEDELMEVLIERLKVPHVEDTDGGMGVLMSRAHHE